MTADSAYADAIVDELVTLAAALETHWSDRGQLAALVLGSLFDDGALRWDAQVTAADGQRSGVMVIDYDRMPAAATELMRIVMHILATRDHAAYEALFARIRDGRTLPLSDVRERGEVSLVYTIRW